MSRNWHRVVLAVALVLGTSLLAPASARAQFRGRRPRGGMGFGGVGMGSAGVRMGYDFTVDAWSLGAQMSLPLARYLSLVPSGDLFFRSDHTDWQLNFDGMFGLGRQRLLYGGLGLGVLNRVFDNSGVATTRTGLNLLAGFRLPARRLPLTPFVEARWTKIHDEQTPFRLVVGVSAPMGGRRGPG